MKFATGITTTRVVTNF